MVMNEVLHKAKIFVDDFLLLKLDTIKAFDSVGWDICSTRKTRVWDKFPLDDQINLCRSLIRHLIVGTSNKIDHPQEIT